MNINELFKSELKVINLGLESFHEAQVNQHAVSLHIDWSPPAGGDPRLIEILEKLSGEENE